jgi:hypothetical protein
MKHFLSIGFAAALMSWGQAAEACTCKPTTIESNFTMARAVVVGTVTRTADIGYLAPPRRRLEQEVQLRLDTVYKNDLGIGLESGFTIPLRQGGLDKSCGYPLHRGESYLLFLREDGLNRLHAHYCTGSDTLESAKESGTLAKVEELSEETQQTRSAR